MMELKPLRVAILAFACVVAGGTVVVAQQNTADGAQKQPPAGKKEAKSTALPELPATLEEMLAVALRSNPEILKADAKVRKAQADLNQVRLKVTQDIITAFHERTKEMESLKVVDAQEENVRRMIAVGTMPQGLLFESQLASANAKARIAQGEAQLRYVMGLGGSSNVSGVGSGVAPSTPEPKRPPIPDTLRPVLDKEMTVAFDDTLLFTVFDHLKEVSGLTIMPGRNLVNFQFSLKLANVPLRTVLVAISDQTGVCFVFREYGILAIQREQAQTMNSPVIPEEIPLKLNGPAR